MNIALYWENFIDFKEGLKLLGSFNATTPEARLFHCGKVLGIVSPQTTLIRQTRSTDSFNPLKDHCHH